MYPDYDVRFEPPCEICGKPKDSGCSCPECPVCKTVGRLACESEHDLDLTGHKMLRLKDWTDCETIREWQKEIYNNSECGISLKVYTNEGIIDTDNPKASHMKENTIVNSVALSSIVEGFDAVFGDYDAQSPSEIPNIIQFLENEVDEFLAEQE